MTVADAAAVDFEAVLAGLAELGPPSQVRSHSPRLAAEALDLDRVLLSGIRDGALAAEAVHVVSGDNVGELLAAMRDHHVALDYPLIEGEILRRRRARLVNASSEAAGGHHAFASILRWTSYVAAPIVLDGRPIGFFHADRHVRGGDVTELDVTRLASFAACFAVVYERAILRHRLRVQREEMRQVAGWASARTGELGDRSITLVEDGDVGSRPGAVGTSASNETALRDLLTRRELDVLELMVRGATNAGIARALIVSEGTVKFHVKNILRKLHAANRAEATSRYLRLTLRRDDRG